MFAASALLLGLAPAPAPKKATVGQPAPDFKLKTFAREDISLADLKGQVIVINLWATWCVPCKAEMPMMDAYFRANRDKGLRIFGVQTEDSVAPFRLKEVAKALSYPLTLQFRSNAYPQLEGVPTTYIIDRKGVVRYAKANAFSHQSFDAEIRPLLAEAP
jgi:cytochrome c biogenesis protein CcmG/thiol:disulfide interchange protein DsbE